MSCEGGTRYDLRTNRGTQPIVAYASRTIPAVFAEVRRMLGNAATTLEALQFAAALVALYRLRTAPQKLYDLEVLGEVDGGWQYFEELPIDVAMRDGGWRILEYEYEYLRPESTEFREIELSKEAAKYVEPYWPAPCDRTNAESIQWLAVSLRASQIEVDHVDEILLDASEADEDD